MDDEREAERAIREAVELGVRLFDTADVYGVGGNERLVGRVLRDLRDDVMIATKFGNLVDENGAIAGVDGRPEYVRAACDASLRRLGVETIDLYQQHRTDPDVPIEETIGTVAEVVREGKVRHIGLSEARPEDIRRAAAVTTIATLQSEYSLFERSPELDVLPLCAELGIAFVAYAPLDRGIIAGGLRPDTTLAEGDARRNLYPRLIGEHLEENARTAKRVRRSAERLMRRRLSLRSPGCSTARSAWSRFSGRVRSRAGARTRAAYGCRCPMMSLPNSSPSSGRAPRPPARASVRNTYPSTSPWSA